jgi:hypothetical protein
VGQNSDQDNYNLVSSFYSPRYIPNNYSHHQHKNNIVLHILHIHISLICQMSLLHKHSLLPSHGELGHYRCYTGNRKQNMSHICRNIIDIPINILYHRSHLDKNKLVRDPGGLRGLASPDTQYSCKGHPHKCHKYSHRLHNLDIPPQLLGWGGIACTSPSN